MPGPTDRGYPFPSDNPVRSEKPVSRADFQETALVDNTLDPCDLPAWARQPESPGATRHLTPGSAAHGSRRRVTTATRLPSVGAPAAAIISGSTSGTRMRDGFAPRRIIGGHPFTGIGTPWPRAGGTECSAPQWRTSSTTAPPWLGVRTSGSSFGPLRPSIGSASRNDRKIWPACCPTIGEGWANVWLGTTTENQIEATRRIPCLVAIPAVVRFLCVEPMLQAIDLSPWLGELDWLIVGGELGVGTRSRPMHPDWVRDLRDQVRAAGGAFFLKQVGSNRALWPRVKHRKGENPIEWPPDLQIQDLPRRSEPSM